MCFKVKIPQMMGWLERLEKLSVLGTQMQTRNNLVKT